MLLFLACAATALARFIVRSGPLTGDPQFIDQQLDHFNPFEKTIFKQRYFQNEVFAKSSARAAILEIGGEGEISRAPGGTLESPDVLGRVAKKYGAQIYQLEHRFYGVSHPFPVGDGTYDTSADKLKYLTSRQAIADLIEFMEQIEKSTCSESERIPGKPCIKWIVVGGSYPGALAGWITEHHPGKFVAGLSSSGVVNAKYENPDFDTHTFSTAGAPCGEALRQASNEITRKLETGDKSPLKKLNISEDADLGDVHYFIADASLMCFQYGSSPECCDKRLVQAWNDYTALDDALISYLNYASDFATYDSKAMSSPYVEHGSAFRQWWSQTCLEMAYFQPAPALNSIRSPAISMDWHLGMCKRLFSWTLGDPTVRTNEYFGGDKVVSPDCFFSNFYQDIWHLCGKTTTDDNNVDNIGYVMCKDCAHCVDLHSDKATDPAELTALRLRIEQFMAARMDAYIARA